MGKYLIYSVEDDAEIANVINVTLKKQGYEVETFKTGEDFLIAFTARKPNIVLLDLMLPGIQGKEVLHQIRSDKANDNIAVIIVSAKSLTMDKVDGLDTGADDYITKPFDLLEFMSRINAHARRYLSSNIIEIGEYTLDFDDKVFKKSRKLIDLTSTEFRIISMMFSKRGEVVSKSDIEKVLYGETFDPIRNKKESRTIDMHIRSIRRKIGDQNRKFLVTVYNVGFIIH